MLNLLIKLLILSGGAGFRVLKMKAAIETGWQSTYATAHRAALSLSPRLPPKM